MVTMRCLNHQSWTKFCLAAYSSAFRSSRSRSIDAHRKQSVVIISCFQDASSMPKRWSRSLSLARVGSVCANSPRTQVTTQRRNACTHASCQRQVTQSLRQSFGSCHDHRMLARRPTHGAVRPMRHVVPRRCDFTVPVHWLPATCAPHHVQHRSAQISSMACCQQ